MHQDAYVRDVLTRFGMSECCAVSTPADHHVRLCKTGTYRVDKGAPLQGGHDTQGCVMILMSMSRLFVRLHLIVNCSGVCCGCL